MVGVVGTSTVSLRYQIAEMLETEYVGLFVRYGAGDAGGKRII